MNRRILLGTRARRRALRPRARQDKSIVVASTTSTQDSGLFGHILPIFKAKTGIDVKVISQGTGQALDTGRRGDADVVFVHARPQEEKFVADGFGVKRFAVMYNDFILIGPKSDPAGVKGKDIETALKAIKAKAAPFVSRGDKSGTHAAELALWKAAGIDIADGQGPLVHTRDRPGHGRRAQHRVVDERLCAGRSRHVARVQEPRRTRHRGRGRQAAVQPIRRHAGEPGEASACEGGAGPAVHRLARLGRRPEGDRRLQDQRRSSCSSRTPRFRGRKCSRVL